MIDGTLEKCFAIVRMANDQPIAFIVCNNTRDPKELYIQFIMVAEKFRKRGIASQGLQRMESIAKEKHFLKLTLDVDQNNKTAKHLYEKMANLIADDDDDERSEEDTIYIIGQG